MGICDVCGREARGFGYKKQKACSMRCMEILHQYGKKNKMIGASDNEREAIKSGMESGYQYSVVHIPELANALSQISREQMLELGACITGGFTDKLAELAEYDIPF